MALFGNVVGSTRNFTLTADFLKKYDVIILQALETVSTPAFGLSPVTRSVLCLTGEQRRRPHYDERLWLAVAGGRSGQSIAGAIRDFLPTEPGYFVRATVPTICATVPTGRFRLAVGIPRTARWSTILIRRTAKWVSSWAAPSLAPIARSWHVADQYLGWRSQQVGAGGSSPGPTSGHLHQPVERRFDLPGPSPVRELHRGQNLQHPAVLVQRVPLGGGRRSSCFQMADTTVIQR